MDSKGDIGLEEDLAFALAHLVALEHHAEISYGMTKDKKWLEVENIAREIRQKWLKLIVRNPTAHTWCISKHLLGSFMGLSEIGNRYNTTKQYNESCQAYDDATRLMALMFVINEEDKGESS